MTDETAIDAEKIAALDAVAARIGKEINYYLPRWCERFTKIDPSTMPLNYVSNVLLSLAVTVLLHAGLMISREEFQRRAGHLYDQTMGNHLMSRKPQ